MARFGYGADAQEVFEKVGEVCDVHDHNGPYTRDEFISMLLIEPHPKVRLAQSIKKLQTKIYARFFLNSFPTLSAFVSP